MSVNSLEELKALPEKSVIRDAKGGIGELYGPAVFWTGSDIEECVECIQLPADVLFDPRAPQCSWTEWGVERNTLDGARTVAPMQSRKEAEHVAQMWDTSTGVGPLDPVAVFRNIQGSAWSPVERGGHLEVSQ